MNVQIRMDREMAHSALDGFRRALCSGGDRVARLRAGVIGEGVTIDGPFGPKPLIYADYVASGRALRQVEAFVAERVLPFYANSHTEASYCGAYISRMRAEARAGIARIVGATDDYAVIFTGSGATAGINRLIGLLGIETAGEAGERPVVFTGPYEHHSNILPWRESGAEVVEIGEADAGGPDLDHLQAELARTATRRLRVGAFSAASNVTGVVTDTDRMTALLNSHGVVSVWDYAAGAPYLPMSVAADGPAAKDALVFSPHKFVGGPGASGVLVVRKAIAAGRAPTWPGGGTVAFVSPWDHDYSEDLASREEGGTPNVVGDIRAALALLVKEAVGQAFIDRRNAELEARALAVWRSNPHLRLLGADKRPRLPIFSFQVRDGRDGLVHHQLFTRMLSDCFGIQARGGCACAGPYAHRLLGIDAQASAELRKRIRAGDEMAKPGWVRLNLSYLLDDAKADTIISCVDKLARNPLPPAARYESDPLTARFRPIHATSSQAGA